MGEQQWCFGWRFINDHYIVHTIASCRSQRNDSSDAFVYFTALQRVETTHRSSKSQKSPARALARTNARASTRKCAGSSASGAREWLWRIIVRWRNRSAVKNRSRCSSSSSNGWLHLHRSRKPSRPAPRGLTDSADGKCRRGGCWCAAPDSSRWHRRCLVTADCDVTRGHFIAVSPSKPVAVFFGTPLNTHAKVQMGELKGSGGMGDLVMATNVWGNEKRLTTRCRIAIGVIDSWRNRRWQRPAVPRRQTISLIFTTAVNWWQQMTAVPRQDAFHYKPSETVQHSVFR